MTDKSFWTYEYDGELADLEGLLTQAAAQEAGQTADDMFRAFDLLPAAALLVTRDGTIRHANAAALALLAPDQRTSLDDVLGDPALLARYAEPVYGVVPGDPDATERRRAERREERARDAVPVHEWMVSERRRVLDREMIEPVQRMYAESMRLSERFAREFRAFWELPDDFDFPVATPEVDVARTLRAQADGAGA
jgi:hypothetical protein